jgi:hypothetical protein
VAPAGSGITPQDYSITTSICHNGSAMSLIPGYQFSTATEQSIINSPNAQFFKSVYDLTTQQTDDWYRTAADSILYSREDAADSTVLVGSRTTSAAAPLISSVVLPAAAPASAITSVTGGWSLGFIERCRLFRLNVINTGGYINNTIQGTAIIPLALYDDFFRAHDFPMTNDRRMINFSLGFVPVSVLPDPTALATPTVTMYCPFQFPRSVPPPVIKIGHASMSSCRLIYDKIDLSPLANFEAMKKLNEGFTKTVYYRQCEPLKVNTFILDANGRSALPSLVSSNSRNVTRLIVMMYSKNAWQDPSSLAPVLTYHNSASVTRQPRLVNTNINVNQQKYFSNDLSRPAEFWSQIQQGFPFSDESRTSLLSLKDFLVGKSYYTFNLQRARDDLTSPNDPLAIEFTAELVDGVANDEVSVVYIVETERSYTFQMSSTNSALLSVSS